MNQRRLWLDSHLPERLLLCPSTLQGPFFNALLGLGRAVLSSAEESGADSVTQADVLE